MDAKIPLLFAALASTAAFGQGKNLTAPPSDPYTDKDSGFVFPPTVGSFHRGGVSHVKDPTALWVDYGAPGAKVSIRIILRAPMAGPNGIVSCQADMEKERETVKRRPYFAGFSELKSPKFAGYTGRAWAEEFGPPKAGGTGYDTYTYCSQTKSWMVIYGFQRAKDIDVKAQEIAFIKGAKPPEK